MPESSRENRRACARQDTHRRAQCFDPGTDEVLAGRIVNVSAGGLQLALSRRLAPGRCLEVEIAPRDDHVGEDPILVRAEVLWHRLRDDGSHLHGMRLHMALDQYGASDALAAADVADRLAAFKDSLATMSRPGELMPLARPLDSSDSTDIVTKSPERRRQMLVLLALLLFLVPAGTCIKDSGDIEKKRQAYQPERSVMVTPRADREEQDVRQTDLDGSVARLQSLDAVYHAFLNGDHARSESLLRALDQFPGLSPVERFLVRAARAQMTYAEGRPVEGIALMRAALAEAPAELPEAWRSAGEEMLAGLPHVPVGIVPLWGFHRSAILSETDGSEEQGGIRDVRVEIDLSDYLMRIYHGDELAAVLPVGIGEMDGTPTGSFRIANKLRNPVWYNRGNPVPPGDPENPLGELWMGLGRGGRALPLGLHPTNEPDSIGAARSAGCVRLRPEDAARLDALCKVGTPVRIVP